MPIQHFHEELYRLQAHPGISLAEGIEFQEHHQAHDVQGHGWPYTGSMAEDEAVLQLCHLARGNTHLGKLAESRIDAIHRTSVLENGFDHLPAVSDSRLPCLVKGDSSAGQTETRPGCRGLGARL